MQWNSWLSQLLKDKKFTAKIISIVFDEAHCITDWGDFRKEYKHLGRLRYWAVEDTPFLVTSATLPTGTLRQVRKILQIRPEKLYQSIRSVDRPNIGLVLVQIQHPFDSFDDLDVLFEEWDAWIKGGPKPPKVVIFFDKISDLMKAAKKYRARLPIHLRHMVKTFNSHNTAEYRKDHVDAILTGDCIALFASSCFGMVRT